MIVSEYFPEDNNEDLKSIQHDVYFRSGGKPELGIQFGDYVCGSHRYIFEMAKSSMFNTIFGVPIYNGQNLNEIKTFNHKILQVAHGIIATFYRWLQSQQRKPVLSGQGTSYPVPNSQPNPLSEYHQYVLESWKLYFVHEVCDITHGEFSISEQIVKAVLFGNTPKGYESEDAIHAFLELRYGAEFKKVCGDWSKKF